MEKIFRDSAKNRKQSRQILLVATHLLKFLGILKAVEQKGDPNQMIKFGLQHSICFGIISPFMCEVPEGTAFNFMKVQLSVSSYNSNECTYQLLYISPNKFVRRINNVSSPTKCND